ncbi:hypothetical protein [Occallatibacter riparius]|uniref:Uncharacterized protein n=1 Tax=Occallatibacter riparius TaxID=1002689 RepID=A0A9J7BYT2_9BACT|nr:hypothetical protein [Occallatibacter riparius]UWZ86558.1 hypothetical protein MOP44_11565 [Occallatibacter riparius]
MAASTVNIADFRCRDLKARFGHAQSGFENPNGLELVESAPAADESEAELVEENPGVLDISVARDNPRMRQRFVLHAATASRHRSNLVRFNEPHVTVMKVNAVRALESSDDYDFPPAA